MTFCACKAYSRWTKSEVQKEDLGESRAVQATQKFCFGGERLLGTCVRALTLNPVPR